MNALLAAAPVGWDGGTFRAKAKVSVAVEHISERDPRAMNRMDPETKLIHARLEQWGKETRAREENGLPAATLLGRMIDQGPMGASQLGATVTSLSAATAATDAAVARLWAVGQRCVKRYYNTWEPPEIMAQKEGMHLRRFQEVLKRARELVGLWLDDAERAI